MTDAVSCPACGRPNAADARFCSNCGTSLVTRVGVQERRVVTALFADLARSTGLGATLDPEIVRGIVGRFFEIAAAEVERRGGTVEKFSGDAVMAVFGLPSAHEDDPERAVRAALAIRDAVATLSADTESRHGTAVQARIGIEDGEVVVGDPFGGATMATGDAMNLAARLEQQAEPTEIVIGEGVWNAVRDMVVAEPLGELPIRGRDAPLAAWRVHAISTEVGRPRGVPGLQAPLTGRDEEIALLLDAARRAQHERKAVLFTLVGVPGVGKSRLVRETGERLAADGWRSIRGRCLPYGQGITYWPVAEMVRTLADIGAATTADEAEARLTAASPDADVAAKLGLAIGLRTGDDATVDERGGEGLDREIAWAFRRFAEHAAADAPLMLVFEDIHWAEPPLLDLIEYLATWARDAPLLIVCPTRPELLDARPSWGAGRMEANRIQLEPLTEAESRTLLGALLEVDDIPASLRARILERAEGNPLFVEETVRMLIEEGVVERRGSRWVARPDAADVRVPDSIEALIRARLDTLPAPERAVLQAASVVGRVFQRSAVAAVAGGAGGSAGRRGSDLDRHLEDAVLRDLITEERAPAEATFRFRHILIRDVAYATLPKARRIDLHRAVAAWLREWAGTRRDEFIELEAYHLEQAALLERELEGRFAPADRDAAVTALLRSAVKALARGDARAVRSFAERGLALDPVASGESAELKAALVEALSTLGDYSRAGALAAELELEASALGRPDLEGRALIVKSGQVWLNVEGSDPQTALASLNRARELLTAAGDDYNLATVLDYLGHEGWWYGDLERAETVWLEMREVARRSGLLSREADSSLLLSKIYGLRGEPERRRQMLSEARDLAGRGTSRLTQLVAERMWGSYLALSESAAEGQAVLEPLVNRLEELGVADETSVALSHLGDIELRAGRAEKALELHERGLELVRGHVGFLPEALRSIASARLELGDIVGAARDAEEAVRVVGRDDVSTVASTAATLGTVREAQGNYDEAESLLRRAVEIMATTDYNLWEEEFALAEFLLRRGRVEEGREWLARARTSAAGYGPRSPLLEYVERRAAAADAAGDATRRTGGAAG